ncbi:hypothetical protein N015_00455 [Pseudomonas asturiensis]|uniref:Dockerin domain-containing protein n=1 Tax=Pseudomonas asturiensis TaxID=1190415 RepID=A0ABX6H5Y4_9PSED|nr:hypothetical protein [Pseudomonas asturiensis]QHF00957.1 hypothetical protein N015_00455 [Pseudomonas asturiensis]
MANNYEVRLSIEEIHGDDTPEVLIVFWDSELDNPRTGKKGDVGGSAYATAPGKGMPYNTIRSKSDANSDGHIDAIDDALLLELANTFMKIK